MAAGGQAANLRVLRVLIGQEDFGRRQVLVLWGRGLLMMMMRLSLFVSGLSGKRGGGPCCSCSCSCSCSCRRGRGLKGRHQ